MLATGAGRLREWALISDHTMKQKKVVTYRSLERKAWHMLMVTNSIVAIILNSFLLPIIEEVRVGASHRTISTCIMYYSQLEQEPSAFSKVLNGWSLTRT